MKFEVYYFADKECMEIEADSMEEAENIWRNSHECSESMEPDSEIMHCEETGVSWYINNEPVPEKQLSYEAEHEEEEDDVY